MFLPYDSYSLESLVFRDKMSCRWVMDERRNAEKGALPALKRVILPIGSSNVKMVANRHRHAAYYNKHW